VTGLDPPPVRLGAITAVAVDVVTVRAQVVFDTVAREATVTARAGFAVGSARGCPALDLRQEVDSIALDGRAMSPDSFSHHDLGGGDGAEMRVLERELEPGSQHRLDLTYRLGEPQAEGSRPIGWEGGRLHFDTWMSDLHPGRYLEMWLPANLCHDRFALSLDISVIGGVPHSLITNGDLNVSGPGKSHVVFPRHFTSLSPLLVVVPTDEIEARARALSLRGRGRRLVLQTTCLEGRVDLEACESDISSWLVANAVRYGPWTHGSRFIAFVWQHERGMEYDGATTASIGSLEHEVFHSWFGRGVKPAHASDGWIDEAWTSWATSSRRGGDEGRFAEVELGLDEDPVCLRPPHPWSRRTPVESYGRGARLFAGLANRVGGAARLRSAMASWYSTHAGGFVSTDGLQEHLSTWSATECRPWFDRYVHGRP
jgi:hypothetical protein